MGLGSWLAHRRQQRASLLARRDLDEFLLQLRGLGAAERGLVAAQAADFCRFMYGRGLDLRWPALALQVHPTVETEIAQTIVEQQQRGRGLALPGPMVWAHTLRAINRLELMAGAKEMWCIVARGFDRAELAAIEYNFAMQGGHVLKVKPEFLVIPRDFETD